MISIFGAVLALSVAIILIIKKFNTVYALIFGALVGSFFGGASIDETITLLLDGVSSVVPSVLRILAAGVLAGVLISSGSALVIANKIILKLGEKNAILALSLSSVVLTASGVFVDITMITIAPIALIISKRVKISKIALFVAISGGAKAGNIISPNPNTIALAESFNVALHKLMFVNIAPAIIGLLCSVLLAKFLDKIIKKKNQVVENDVDLDIEAITEQQNASEISFLQAISGPLVSITLLAILPIFQIHVDPLIALPVGGIVACISIGRLKYFNVYVTYGLSRMTMVIILLIGTGALAGVIQHSEISQAIVSLLQHLSVSAKLLAPIAGSLLSLATSSTTAAAIISGTAFSNAIIAGGLKPLFGAAVLNAATTIFDSMPHGSYFHISREAFNIDLKTRLSILKYEILIGTVLLFTASLLFICIL